MYQFINTISKKLKRIIYYTTVFLIQIATSKKFNIYYSWSTSLHCLTVVFNWLFNIYSKASKRSIKKFHSSCSSWQKTFNCFRYQILHYYRFVQLFQNMRIQTEHSIPSTNVGVRIRIRRLAKIFENFTNKNGECERIIKHEDICSHEVQEMLCVMLWARLFLLPCALEGKFQNVKQKWILLITCWPVKYSMNVSKTRLFLV